MAQAIYWMSSYQTFLLLFILFVGFKETVQQNYIEQFTYNAAVVEYQPLQNATGSLEDKQNFTVYEYIRILNEVKKVKDVDIILFPEATLTSPPHPLKPEDVSEVPEPLYEILCNSSSPKYLPFLKQLSCAAVEANTTVVINIIEKENCTSNKVPGFCSSTGWVYYNTDVVLNENGSVLARYRKYNLYGEIGLTPPSQLEVVNFTIRNNVTFGIFTCFDILFYKPALMLVRNGVRNILFPTMWFSELPYLTALQTQQMWAQENNVTFLSAGANNPRVGSGGTGIFVGNKGPLNYTIVGGTGGTRVLIHEVPKIEVPGNPYVEEIEAMEENVDALAESLDEFHLKQDHSVVHEHVSAILDTNKTETILEICNGKIYKLCCHFHIKIKSDNSYQDGKNVYIYHLAAFSGKREFESYQNGGIEACSVLACLNNSVTSCALRFPKYKDIQWPVTFDHINITAEFEDDNERIQFPNSLLSSLRPISPQYTLWITDKTEQKVRRTHILNKPQSRLLTFAIYGRDFGNDFSNSSKSSKLHSQINLILVALIFSFLLVLYRF